MYSLLQSIGKINKHSIRKKRTDVYFVIYIFCALFAPPIIPGINLILIVALYSLVLLFTKYRKEVMTIITKSGMKSLIIGLIIYFLYCVLIIIASIVAGTNVQTDHYIRMFYSFFLLFPVTLVCVLYIITLAKRLGYDMRSLISVFVYAGLIQAGLAVASLVLPEVKEFFVSQMYINTADPLLGTPWITNVRYFGFANSMLDLFGLGMGILAVLSLFLATEKRYGYIILFPILLTSSLLNARTGLIVAVLGIAFFLLYLVIRMRTVVLLMTLASILIVAFLGLKIITSYAPDTIAWVSRDIGSFINTQSTGETGVGTANLLFSERSWVLPDFPGLVVGTGHTLYEANGFKHSDVGYINDLWRTGLVGILLLYVPFLMVLRRAFDWSRDKLISILVIFFFCIFALFLVKGGVWVYSPGMVIALSIMFFAVLARRTKQDSREPNNE